MMPVQVPVGVVLDPATNRQNRRVNLLSVGIPVAGTLLALGLAAAGLAPTLGTFVVFLLFFLVNAVAITIGLHRYFAHRAFKTSTAMQWVLGVLGTWAFQGPAVRWIADHRRHHRFSDQPWDVHSPYWKNGQPLQTYRAQFWHSHAGWLFSGHVSAEREFAADCAHDRPVQWLSRHYWMVASSGLAAPALVGMAIGGWPEAVTCLLWAGCVRVTLLHQLTWAVNSVGHLHGYRDPASTDQSRDSPLLALLIVGEGLHNFHHRHAYTALNQPHCFDFSGALIGWMERLGLVWDVRRAEPADRHR